MHDIGCIIISSSDDFGFLDVTLRKCASLFSKVVVSIGTKLWNGDAENEEKIEDFVAAHNVDNIHFVRYNIPSDMMTVMKNTVSPEMYWESHARWVAHKLLGQVEYILYLDADEVIDASSFKEWLDTNEYKNYDAIKLKNYWYFREPIYCARGYFEDSVVLAKRTSFNPIHLFSNMGRHGVYEGCGGAKKRNMEGLDRLPMIHHYSWVRNHEQMLRKVRAWGHRNDRLDWESLVNNEFAKPFSGTDFLKGLQYDIVDNLLLKN